MCFFRIMAALDERTFIAVKPEGVQRGIIGEIIKRFETKGFKLVGMKMLQVCNLVQLSSQEHVLFHNTSLNTCLEPLVRVKPLS